VDLRKSARQSSSADSKISIPAARQALGQLTGSAYQGAVGRSFFTHRPASAAAPVAARLRRFIGMAEGALVLVGAYILIGAGIGEAAGSVVVGMAAGLFAGVCAIAAILLITGSAHAARAADNQGRRVPQGR
jgi:hypothetical protein